MTDAESLPFEYGVFEQSDAEVEQQILEYVGHYQAGGGSAPLDALVADLDASHVNALTSILKMLVNGDLYAPRAGSLKTTRSVIDNGGDDR